VSTIRLYIDEDSSRKAFIDALRTHNVDLTTALEEGLTGHADIEQLRWAATQQRVLYSFNGGDFYNLHTTFLAQGESHAGLIIAQQRFSVGAQAPGVLQLIAAESAEDMTDAAEFLGAWIGTP